MDGQVLQPAIRVTVSRSYVFVVLGLAYSFVVGPQIELTQLYGSHCSSRRMRVCNSRILRLEKFKTLISKLELVLFHCSFNAAKFRCVVTLSMGPDEHLLGGEARLFEG
jgi:hypothetical protein